ncbi:MAG: NAD-dependent epimerase/dehydratase family protein [Oscillospiraceae bacterium]
MENRKKRILITGAGGYVGLELVKQILTATSYDVIAMSNNKSGILNSISHLSADNRISYLPRESVLDNTLPLDGVDIVVHLAFARKEIPQSELVDSMIFAEKLFLQVRDNKVPALINISSQSVYGSAEGLHCESSDMCPLGYYALAKCANEIILDGIFYGCDTTHATNIRLDSIAGNKNLIPTLVRQGIEDKLMKLKGGEQVFSLLDVRDAAAGILSLCQTNPEKWERVYDLGWNDVTYNLVEVANLVKARLEKRGISGIDISLEKCDIKTYAGMDTTKLTALTGWKPRYALPDIIDAVIEDYYARTRN